MYLIYISLWTNYNFVDYDDDYLAENIYISLWTNYNIRPNRFLANGIIFTFHYELIITITLAEIYEKWSDLHFTMN